MTMSNSHDTFRFRDFELDVGAYELRRNGRRVRIERQPMDLLLLLVERRRQLVLRCEIIDRLWGKDVFIDVDSGVNTAIRKVRQALRDSPAGPTFVETVSGKGYRFIATVEIAVLPHGDAHGVERPSDVPLKCADGCRQARQAAHAPFAR
jgi:DNA-binding winged helix-turn-helix (wHTH) protein